MVLDILRVGVLQGGGGHSPGEKGPGRVLRGYPRDYPPRVLSREKSLPRWAWGGGGQPWGRGERPPEGLSRGEGYSRCGRTGLLQRDILGGYSLGTVLLRAGRTETAAPGPPPTRPPARPRVSSLFHFRFRRSGSHRHRSMEDSDCDSTWDEDEEENGEGPRAEAGEDGETGALGNAEAEEDAPPSALQVPPPRPGNPAPLGRPRRQRGQSPVSGKPFPAPPRGQV